MRMMPMCAAVFCVAATTIMACGGGDDSGSNDAGADSPLDAPGADAGKDARGQDAAGEGGKDAQGSDGSNDAPGDATEGGGDDASEAGDDVSEAGDDVSEAGDDVAEAGDDVSEAGDDASDGGPSDAMVVCSNFNDYGGGGVGPDGGFSCLDGEQYVCANAKFQIECDCPQATCTCSKNGVPVQIVPYLGACQQQCTQPNFAMIASQCGIPY